VRVDRPPRVTLLATGGTVSTTSGPDGVSAPTLSGAELGELLGASPVELTVRELARAPSWSLGPAEMAHIAVAAAGAAHEPGVDGVVVTHGTSTLEYTAFLADLVVDAQAPVVVTGAMRRADDASPDGPRNLADAVAVATSAAARGAGALVVFAGHVIAGDRAWKARRADVDAFLALDGGLGTVEDGAVRIGARSRKRAVFSGRLDASVALVKAVPGMDGAALRAAVDDGAHGLVVEGLPGSGGIPPSMLPALREVASRVPVVLASRAPFGRLPDEPTGGTGEPLRGLGLLSARALTAEQAWLLLMASLGDGTDDADVRRRFAAAADSVGSGS
jgi:L-asparaginase